MTTPTYEPPAPIVDLANTLLDQAIVSHSNGDETFQECLMCGEWEGHTDTCPVPLLARWIAS